MIITGPSNTKVIYGDDVTLTCTVFSDEIPEIIWKHIQTSKRIRIKPKMTSNSLKYDCSLMISNVDLMDSGDYFFNVSNTIGSKNSKPASLLVIGWLILNYILLCTCLSIFINIIIYNLSILHSVSLCIVPLPNVTISPGSVNVSYNSTVTLSCIVQSLTTPTVIWINDTNVTLPSTSLISNNDSNIHNHTLILEQVTLDYIGEYNCTAENEGGEISDVINVDIYGKEMCIHLSICFTIPIEMRIKTIPYIIVARI